MNIAIIPARGGSKRIPRKNIKNFLGKPIIAYSIESALNSQCFDKVIVSTDDPEIAKIAEDCGAEVPFMRPNEISDDHTGTRAVINHGILELEKAGIKVENACCIYATAPFISSKDLRTGLANLQSEDVWFSLPVSSYNFPIQRSVFLNEKGGAEPVFPDLMGARSQDLQEAYHDAGQFYWGKSVEFLANKPLYSEHTVPVIVPSFRVQDIDTDDDWKRAEIIYRFLEEENFLEGQ